jgi:hypothetical protein
MKADIERRIEILEKRQPPAERLAKFVTEAEAEPARREEEARMDEEQAHPELIEQREARLRADGYPEFLIDIERERRESYYAEKAVLKSNR